MSKTSRELKEKRNNTRSHMTYILCSQLRVAEGHMKTVSTQKVTLSICLQRSYSTSST